MLDRVLYQRLERERRYEGFRQSANRWPAPISIGYPGAAIRCLNSLHHRAYRFRAEGLHVKAKIDAPWFLNDRSDVRSSFYCEEVGTEFDVQGLELDWAGVCWDSRRVGSLGADSERFLDNGQFEFLQTYVLCCEDTFRHLTLRRAGENT